MNSDSLKKYFEQFGKISYISLPKFKSSDQPRGFAFIEFSEKESAKKAVEVYRFNTKMVYLIIMTKNIYFNKNYSNLKI